MKGFPLYLPNLYGEHRSGHYRGQHVADGVGAPHAVETEEMWQDIQIPKVLLQIISFLWSRFYIIYYIFLF